ncbi:MAG: 2-amino-4-hydroxy-6-hydroxymethyldihydropteridine diphosphokinase [Syntrophus sp. (in: bacteria)]|nr:2-amino-4-hydroxy-6-hydroxymethyldihydropteridine diphosphokinase [Syntrophus sp. (in: bacteria)]
MDNRIFIGIGSNIGNSVHHCITGIKTIIDDSRVGFLDTSSLYITSPVSPIPQGDFINCVISFIWEGSPISLLEFLHHIEHAMGRVRDVVSGPRIIDLDILLFKGITLDNLSLKIPHPGLHERKFTLIPCLEIDPLLTHPLYLKPLSSFLDAIDDTQRISVFTSAEEVRRNIS